jgi:hypothetical protein
MLLVNKNFHAVCEQVPALEQSIAAYSSSEAADEDPGGFR